MTDRKYLIFDFGASHGRGVLARFNGKVFSFEEIHQFKNTPAYLAGTWYWDLPNLFTEMISGIQKAVRDHGTIDSIGLDTWGVDFGFLSREGKLLANPIHYRDPRRHSVSDALFSQIDRMDLFQSTGIFQLTIMSLYLYFALKQDDAPEYRNADSFQMMPDLFHYLLTGETFNEYTIATTSLFFNQMKKEWAEDVLNTLSLRKDILNPIIYPGTKIGPLSKGLQEEYSLSPINVTAAAGHDTASAIAGIPLSSAEQEWAYISLGTWAVAGCETDEPVLTREVLDSGVGNEGSADGKTFLARNITGLWIIQECREKWNRDSGRDIPWEEIVSAAEKAEAFAAFIDTDDPVFAQVVPDMPEVVRTWCEKREQQVKADMGIIARIIFESLVMKFREVLCQIEDLTGKRFELVHLFGGGTNNCLVCQWTADILNLPVTAGPAETTVMGNALMQLQGSGEISSLKEGRSIVRASSKTEEFRPKHHAAWMQAYGDYQKRSSI